MQVSTVLINLDLSKIQKNKMNVCYSNSYHNSIDCYNTATPAFPTKLYNMLAEAVNAGKESIVAWNPDGKSFKANDPKKFVVEILPNHFKQTQYKSFQRQLNFYGFVRITHGQSEGSYENPFICSWKQKTSSKYQENSKEEAETSLH